MLLYACWVLLLIGVVSADYNYCRDTKCRKRHVACQNANNEHELAAECEAGAKIIDPDTIKDYILYYHNHIRNVIAAGYHDLSPAAAMSPISWDNELARLAKMNVNSCAVKFDKCHDTEKFADPSQNVFKFTIQHQEDLSVQDVIKDVMNEWGAGVQTISSDMVSEFPERPSSEIRAFANMISDRSTHIGCAAVIVQEKKGGNGGDGGNAYDDNDITRDEDHCIWYPDSCKEKTTTIYITCNYSEKPHEGSEIYWQSTDPASDCSNGADEEFKNLCKKVSDSNENLTEPIEPIEPTEIPQESTTEDYFYV